MKAEIESAVLKCKPSMRKPQLNLYVKHFTSGVKHLAKERKISEKDLLSTLCDLISSSKRISLRLVFTAANKLATSKVLPEGKPISKMNKDELIAKAIEVGVDPESQDLTKLKNADLRDLIVSTIEENNS